MTETIADQEPGAPVIKPDYDPSLTNKDLAPLTKQSWNWYNIFAFWMSDVHSVGGYTTAGSLFALGIASWQVLIALVAGILIVQVFANLVAKPSQAAGVPYPVVNRHVFGVRGANVPAIIRGVIAIAWYGVQTYLASTALEIVFLKFWPSMASLDAHTFAGLSALGYLCYGILWVIQGAVFWRGMGAIRRFIDWAGPAVYVVMIILCGYLVAKAGWSHISLSLHAGPGLDPLHAFYTTLNSVALVVAYFAGPMLNFGDFARYGKSFKAVKRGNFMGLPVNFLFFSILTVLTASATLPVYGKLITDPIQTVKQIDTATAILLGGLTFVIATVGINIVANFISPAFDFSNVKPQRISWRTGGMIAAIGSVVITPWNWYDNTQAIDYTLNILGALIGPLFGILIAGYYVVSRQRVWVDDLYSTSPAGRYWFRGGYNPNAIWSVVIGGVPAIAAVLIPVAFPALNVAWISDWSWFIGCGAGFAAFALLERRSPVITGLDRDVELCRDGKAAEATPAGLSGGARARPAAIITVMDFEDLVAEAAAVDVSGWDFSWLDGRATEERPPWGYQRLMGEKIGRASVTLDIQTGGGEVLAGVEQRAARSMVATESWPPNIAVAQRNLRAKGVVVVADADEPPLPFAGGAFDLVTSRHPVKAHWDEIARVLAPGGTYFSQQVGPELTGREVREFFLGPHPAEPDADGRDRVRAAVEGAGLDVADLRTARTRMEFFDVGAMVYFLRKVIWFVPDFTVETYRDRLKALHDRIGADGPFVSWSTRFLIEARKPA